MAEVGTGITITGATGFLAEILSVSEGGLTRPPIDVTHMISATRDYVPGKLSDQGQMDVEIAFDPALAPPIDAAAETWEITYPTGHKWSRTGFMTNFQTQAPLEERMTATCSIKWTGALTLTAPP